MTDDKTPEENPIAGQYTFFPAQDALDGTAEQEAQEASRRIYIVTTPDPGGDPTAPDFDPVAYKERIGLATERVKTALDDSIKRVAENLLNETGMGTLRELAAEISKQAIEGVNQAGKLAFDALSAYFKSAEFDAIKSLARAASEAIALQRERYEALTDRQKDLAPFLEDELLADPNLANVSVYEALAQGLDDNGNPKDGPLKEVIERAFAQLADYEAALEQIASADLFADTAPILQGITPRQYVMPNNLLMKDLAGETGKQPINAGEYDMPVIPETKRQREITTFVMATYEPEKGIISSLTEYERDISDAFISIWEQARKDKKPAAFTPDMIYRAMPGRGERPSKQQKGAITKAVEKFLHLYLEVDATDELRKRGKIGAGDTYHVKDYYLRAQEHIYKAKGGQAVKAWVMTGEPLILSYARLTGQLLSVPAKYLAIEKVKQGAPSGELLTMNAGRQAMTSYMLRRIAVIKHDYERAADALRKYERRRKSDQTLPAKPLAAFREQNDTILFDTLFKTTGTASENREITRRNREFCFDVLDYWKATGYIKGYRQQAKGRSITGVTIEH